MQQSAKLWSSDLTYTTSEYTARKNMLTESDIQFLFFSLPKTCNNEYFNVSVLPHRSFSLFLSNTGSAAVAGYDATAVISSWPTRQNVLYINKKRIASFIHIQDIDKPNNSVDWS